MKEFFDEVLAIIEKVLRLYKEFMAWLGILVLPEEDGSDGYPPTGDGDGSASDNI